ncbi:MAG TPA: hypothetical protein VH591_19795 [Ktedonobacterales bacterium]|jgi:hypothetical protein
MTFSASASYSDILRGLTDLGVQPAVFCGYPQDFADGSAIQGSLWLPAGQRARFQQEHRMFVVPTLAHAPDWATKIYALPGAHRDTSTQSIPCTDGQPVGSQTPSSSNAPNVLTTDQVGNQTSMYAFVTFLPSVSYDAALYDVSNLGLRLADPCYEYALVKQSSPQWRPMGQETIFGVSHALVVAAAPLTSATIWRNQLRTLPDVSTVDTSYHPAC